MQRILDWFIDNRVAATLLMLLLIAGGGMAIIRTNVQVFPDTEMDQVLVTVAYPGATPDEVEDGVVTRIEDAVTGLRGVDRVKSISREHLGVVTIEAISGTDMDKLKDDVKNRIDAIDSFPDDSETPTIETVANRIQTINLALTGNTDLRTLKRLAQNIRDDLRTRDSISQIDIVGVPNDELSISINKETLQAYKLSIQDISQAIQAFSFSLPAGSISTERGDIMLRTNARAESDTAFADIPIRSFPDGSTLTLGTIAEIHDGLEDTDMLSRCDGKPAVMLQLFRIGNESATQIVETAEAYINETPLPHGITLVPWQDMSLILRSRIDLLVRNGVQGLLLVLGVLALFLRLRLALWVAVGIPLSFAGAIWVMPLIGVSINMISLFAFILVLGIVVDDAIVIAESIFSAREKEPDSPQAGSLAAKKGVAAVGTPVIFAVLTTVAAFMPMTAVDGMIGKVMANIPLVVIPALLFSLIESLLVLPSHLSHLRKERAEDNRSNPWARIQDSVARGLRWVIKRLYVPTLRHALHWRYAVLAGSLSILLVTVGLIISGIAPFHFFPSVEADNIAVSIEMPIGTTIEQTELAIDQLEKTYIEMKQNIFEQTGQNPFKHIITSVGSQPFAAAQAGALAGPNAFVGSHLGELNIELLPAEERDETLGSNKLMEEWRKRTGPIIGALKVSFAANLMHMGKPVDVQLASINNEQLLQAVAHVNAWMHEQDGVIDIDDSQRTGKPEIHLELLPGAETLGVTLASVTQHIRHAFYGEEAQVVQRLGESVTVRIRYPEEDRTNVSNVFDTDIITASGERVPLRTVAKVTEPQAGYSTINRTNSQRTFHVSADIDYSITTASTISDALVHDCLSDLNKQFPAVQWSFEGEQREQMKTMSGLLTGFAIAAIIIYGLLAIPLSSYSQPLVIMTAIPFGFIGAVFGHIVTGYDLSVMSIFGLVALAGVAVNDSLVLVTAINKRRKEMPLLQAVEEAGIARFRAITLTSITTFVGLTPLLLEKSMQARFLIPMGLSLAWGVLFATIITLILVPSTYIIIDDLKRLRKKPSL